MDSNEIKIALLNWKIKPQKVESIYNSAWEIDGQYVLKCGKNTSEIEKSLRLSKLLCAQGMPVTKYIETADGRLFVSNDKGYYCLVHKLNGVHLDVFQSEKGFPIQLGEILAKLHQALKNIEDKAECQHKDLLEEWNNYILPEIVAKKIDVPQKAIADVLHWLENIYPILPRQLIHRDPHMGNLLFEDGVLTGYIDFDLSVNNSRIFDICYFSLSFLIGNTDDMKKSKRFNSIFADIVKGYEKSTKLSDLEHQSFKSMMIYIELLFVSFWSREGNVVQMQEAINMEKWVMENL